MIAPKEFNCFFFIINPLYILIEEQFTKELKTVSKIALDIKLNPPDFKKFHNFMGKLGKWVNIE